MPGILYFGYPYGPNAPGKENAEGKEIRAGLHFCPGHAIIPVQVCCSSEVRALPVGGESVARIYTRQEVRRRRLNFQIFAGIYDFIGVVAGIAVIVACALLLAALISWVARDGKESFTSLWNIFQDAIIIPK